MKNIFKKLKRYITSTYMCLKYPFLYPRNRFTGAHYNNWKLIDYHRNNYPKAYTTLCIHQYSINSKQAYQDYAHTLSLSNGQTLWFETEKIGCITIYLETDPIKKIYFKPNTFTKAGFIEPEKKDSSVFSFNLITTEPDGTVPFEIFKIKTDACLAFKISVCDFLNDWVLPVFHCIPSYTEWDSFKSECPGWEKRFGNQLLKELKEQLKKDKLLYKFRIMQIKEKWGRFEFYPSSASKEVYKIIDKYGSLSEGICIYCGKDADYITSSYGWQLPYCKDCLNKYAPNEAIAYYKDENGTWKENEDLEAL